LFYPKQKQTKHVKLTIDNNDIMGDTKAIEQHEVMINL